MTQELFATSRLRVRPLVQADLDWFTALEGDPEVMRYTDRPAQSPEQSAHALLTLAGRTRLDGELCLWAVQTHQGEGIGTAAAYKNDEGVWELGYKLARERWGQGLASELAEALVAYLQAQLPGEPLHAYAFAQNRASCRILEKVGFRLQREWLNDEAGLLDRHYLLGD
ncbi:GNAT family N-acetyltransferase [Ferrimonas balearica]|uniref:GNAT family N-acetyltransferase n=1 Tax=Ferrimonas balearica TaxID=44012 RepID=UPI001C99E515|nr:GNAT family N-acetyltransferase [Ferrimonas balearica]MBY5992058.1 GNAT family N-acetyltransferase [Ferrimonas balearica]